MSLSIFCVTKAEPHAGAFLEEMRLLSLALGSQFVIGADGPDAERVLRDLGFRRHLIRVDSAGYLESVHDQVLGACTGDYVLRLDDDERCSPAMLLWLRNEGYRIDHHWHFARAAMWTPATLLVTDKLWPDPQTRLSLNGMAGGRDHIHAGSPYGQGTQAPGVIEHYNFILRPLAERRLKAARYEAIKPGAGSGGMLPFIVPEDVYTEPVPVAWLGDGDAYMIHRNIAEGRVDHVLLSDGPVPKES